MTVQHWVEHATNNVLTGTQPKDRFEIDLVAMRGELEGAQIALRADEAFTITWWSWEGDFPGLVKGFMVGMFHLDRNSPTTEPHLLQVAPGEFPDPLLDEFPQNVEANDTRSIYLLFDARGVSAGSYTGRVRIGIKDWGVIEVPVQIRVANVLVPPHDAPGMFFSFQDVSLHHIGLHHKVKPWTDEHLEVSLKYARDLAEHRAQFLYLPLDVIRFSRKGKHLRGDFSTFDKWRKAWAEAGVPYVALGVTGLREGDWFSQFRSISVGVQGSKKSAELEEYLPVIEQHFAKEGILDRVFLEIGDEPCNTNIDSWLAIRERMRKAAPLLKVMQAVQVHPQRLNRQVEYPFYFTSHLTHEDGFSEDSIKEEVAADLAAGVSPMYYVCGYTQWFYPGMGIDLHVMRSRMIPWMAFDMGYVGVLHWAYNVHGDYVELTPLMGDCWSIYQDKDGPVSSLRWEALRDGIEDYELLMMARKVSEDKTNEIMREVYRGISDYTLNAEELECARRKLIVLVEDSQCM